MLSVKDKAQQVVEWAKGWDGFEDYLKLNAIVALGGEAALVTNPVDITDTKYIDGSADRRFVFFIRMIMPWSDGFDSTNDDSMKRAERFYDWIVEQGVAKNYPDWEGAKITDVYPLKSYPEMGFVYEEDRLAEYTIDVEIDYTE